MQKSGPVKKPLQLLTAIRSDLAEVDSICINWDQGSDREEKERVEFLMERTFESSLVLMETIGRLETRKHILAMFERARNKFADTGYAVVASEVYSVWSYRLAQILNAVEKVQFQLARDIEEPLDLILRILARYSDVERALRQRYSSRPTLEVRDEYDIQDLLRSLLLIHFEDVSAEDPGPKFAGSSTRVDLLLRKERIVIEIKQTKSDTSESTLGKQLKLDIVDYKQRGDCDALVIFIDDRNVRLKNPGGFASDLMKLEEGFRVEVRVL
jgi:REase_DpnII-MboI